MLHRDSINFNLAMTRKKPCLQKQIKILTARQIWRTQGLYEVSNPDDETIKKALEVYKKIEFVK